MTTLIYSSDAWKLLNGIISVYKPPGMPSKLLVNTLKSSIVSDLNRMQRRVDPAFLLAAGQVMQRGTSLVDQRAVCQLTELAALPPPGDWGGGTSLPANPDYASHPLVLGPAYQEEDVRVEAANSLSRRCSGLMVLGINGGCKTASAFRSTRPIHTCQLVAEWGKATATGFKDGKKLAKATWKHMKGKQWRLEAILSAIQASHQKMAWTVAKVDIGSQEAYELAVKGPVKPDLLSDTLVYGIRLRDYSPPEFTLDVQYLGEDHTFLLDLVSEIGIRCKTFAHTKKYRVSQVGYFTAASALLPQEFSLQSVLANMAACQSIIDEHGGLSTDGLDLTTSSGSVYTDFEEEDSDDSEVESDPESFDKFIQNCRTSNGSVRPEQNIY